MISRGFRIFIAVAGVLAAGYGACYLFLRPVYFAWIRWPFHDPPMAGLFGCTLIALAASALLCLRAGQWQQIRVFIEFVVLWFGLVCALDLYVIAAVTLPPEAMPSVYVDTLVNIGLGGGFLFFYLKNRMLETQSRGQGSPGV